VLSGNYLSIKGVQLWSCWALRGKAESSTPSLRPARPRIAQITSNLRTGPKPTGHTLCAVENASGSEISVLSEITRALNKIILVICRTYGVHVGDIRGALLCFGETKQSTSNVLRRLLVNETHSYTWTIAHSSVNLVRAAKWLSKVLERGCLTSA